MKMYLACALSVVLLGFWNPLQVNADPGLTENNSTCRDPSVAAFAAGFYAALVASNDPAIVFKTLPADEGSALYNRTLFKLLIDIGFGEAAATNIAQISSEAVGLIPVFMLGDFFEMKGFSVGEFLKQKQVLTCDSAVLLAITFYNSVQDYLKDSDTCLVESSDTCLYMKAVDIGLLTFIRELNIPTNEEQATNFAQIFLDEYIRKAGIKV